MNKKLLLILSLLFITSLTLTVLNLKSSPKLHADSTMNMYGWAWSDNIGWISFNSSDCDTNNNGVMDSSDALNSACPAMGTTIPSYGVNVDSSGNMSGYAWNDSIGWVSFNSSNGCPPGYGGNCAPRLSGTTFLGWAKILSADGNGWDGWVSLATQAGDTQTYGITLNNTTDLHGYAWGSDVVGWIQFDPVYGGVHINNPLTQSTCNATPISAVTGQTVTWQAVPVGGTTYTYNWSGTEGLSGSASSASIQYQTIGSKTASVVITSGASSATIQCSAPVSVRKPQCSDGIDNDGNGKIDYPADPGCSSPQDDSEYSSASLSCSYNSNVIPNNQSVTYYQSKTVPPGSTCVSEVIKCTDGVISPSNPQGYQYTSCRINPNYKEI